MIFDCKEEIAFQEERESILNKILINHELSFPAKKENSRISKADPITEKHRHVHESTVTEVSNYLVIIPHFNY